MEYKKFNRYCGDEELDIDEWTAGQLFEEAHVLYSTQSIDETVKVLKKLGLEEIAKKALS